MSQAPKGTFRIEIFPHEGQSSFSWEGPATIEALRRASDELQFMVYELLPLEFTIIDTLR